MKNSRKTFVSCSSLLAAVVLGAACAPKDAAPVVNALEAREAWARPADSGAMSAVYFTLGNGGVESDTLVGVSSEIAARTEMHVSMQQGRTMHMSPVTSLPVPAGDSVAFRPLGAHVMLTDLRRPLVPGDTLSVTLRFQSGRTVEVRAGVRQP
ncbi:copper chaperone PCu(A)C [Pseudogemmatithrix spongiicola]|uniref:Copper chaperone PCu(A)C n=1 Tax=Pseudogemmatithrix spongiicola TaxID=3062599 RepID=A0AA49Q466_9BACT|nr:copper chaperone PCu(A)C [Gemmatimonadaceae bacterium 'strain 138']WKW13844.1 copper chaperone PCu(A)C [Gemmatimonadaceae bacterium 'strain 318']